MSTCLTGCPFSRKGQHEHPERLRPLSLGSTQKCLTVRAPVSGSQRWVWVKITPTGNGPQALVHVSTCPALLGLPYLPTASRAFGLRISVLLVLFGLRLKGIEAVQLQEGAWRPSRPGGPAARDGRRAPKHRGGADAKKTKGIPKWLGLVSGNTDQTLRFAPPV